MTKRSTHQNTPSIFQALALLLLFMLLTSQSTIAQGPPGYTYCTSENESFTLPERCHVAYGGNNSFSYLYNQTGTITFNNTTFGDPAPGVVKSGYYKIATSEGNLASLEQALQQLKDHITEVTFLSGEEINAIIDTIEQNIFAIADTGTILLKALEVISCYDSLNGPIFINASTLGGFSNNLNALDGKEIDRAVFVLQQGVFDHVYTPVNIEKYLAMLTNRKYQSADYFPGLCPNPIDSSISYIAKVNASLPREYGTGTAFSDAPARRPTGYYLAPGSVGTVKVPATLVNKGFKILVGAHSVNRAQHGQVDRFFRVTNSFPIEDTLTQIINPFGGGIYIITPYEASEGVVEIALTNVVPAPYFAANAAGTTSLEEWQNTQRHHPAPWADFASDKYMMQVPTSWIYGYEDPVTLMQDWDARMDIVSTLLGYPLAQNNIMLYLQVDVGIQYNGFYGIGNPQVNNIYDPSQVENGNKNHWLIRPGDGFWETEFHEMGHAQLFSKFPGETEAAVNVPAAAIYNQLYGMDIDAALGESFGNAPYITRDQAALNWMVTPNFRAGNPMDISNTTKDEVRYQQRGYAKYIEMAALFGWEVIDSFYKKEQLDYINQVPGDGLSEVDSRILRFSKTSGTDVRPLIHFWGVHPDDTAALSSTLNAEGLSPSKLICERLEHYKSIIPKDNAEFQIHANAFFGGSVPPGGDPDYGSGWYNIWLPLYDETHGALAIQAMEDIINLYFPDGCPAEPPAPIVTVNNPAICAGQTATLTASGAMYYQWSNGATGQTITVHPDSTTIYTVIGKTAGYASEPATVEVIVNPIPEISVDNATICAGQSATLTALGADTYEWSNGETADSIMVSPEMTTIYTVTGYSLGCASDPASSMVAVNPLPAVMVMVDEQEEFAILDAFGPGLTYEWSTGETTPVIQVFESGTYSVTVTDVASCTASSSVTILLVSAVDVKQDVVEIVVAPNPINDALHIVCKGHASTNVTMLNNLGKVVLTDPIFISEGMTRSLSVENLPSGVYYLRIEGTGFVKTLRIVKSGE